MTATITATTAIRYIPVPAAAVEDGDLILTIHGRAVVESVGPTQGDQILIFAEKVEDGGGLVLPFAPGAKIMVGF